MNIPQSAIQPFEPHGLPTLNFIKDMGATTLKIILGIMDALDDFMKRNADDCLMFAPIIDQAQAQALADHLCSWLEETAMKAGADIVKAKARGIWQFHDIVEAVYGESVDIPPPEHIGFMFLIDFTVNDEDVNHLIDHKFNRIPE